MAQTEEGVDNMEAEVEETKRGKSSRRKETKEPVIVEDQVEVSEPVLSRALQELNTLVMANTQVIYCVTSEEERFIRDLRDNVTVPQGIELIHWSTFSGLIRDVDKHERLTCDDPPKASKKKTGTSASKPEFGKTQNPQAALKAIAQYELTEKTEGVIFVMKDMHTVMNEPVPRELRDVISWLTKQEEERPVCMLIVAPELGFSQGPRGSTGLPVTLEKDVVVLEYDLLTRMELEEAIRGAIVEINIAKESNGMTDSLIKMSDDEIQAVARAGQGMTFDEFTRAIATSLIDFDNIDVDRILDHKKHAIKKSDVLEIISVQAGIEEVGGLDLAKEYFMRHKASFSDEAKAFGVDPLKGAVLTGIPGTGKSLFCKSVANLWQLPLLRMDVGKVMGSLVGESERKMRDALKHASACAPCILWIDEIEKGMSGTQSSSHSDGGTTSRVFGTLLTWMQENESDVTLLATANDIQNLPPELIRRFNEVFFVDLPTDEEKQDIFEIHLAKRGRDPKKFDLPALAKAAKEFTGAEVEKVVQEALASAFTAGDKDITNKHIEDSIRDLKPIAKQMATRIGELRSWAEGKARFASSQAIEAKAEKTKKTKTKIDTGMGKIARTVGKKSSVPAKAKA